MNNFSCAKTSFVPPEPRGETEERYILRDVIYWLNFPRRRTSKRGRKSSRHKSERKYFFIIRRSLEAGACKADSNQGWSQHRPLRCLTSVWWPNEKKKCFRRSCKISFSFCLGVCREPEFDMIYILLREWVREKELLRLRQVKSAFDKDIHK